MTVAYTHQSSHPKLTYSKEELRQLLDRVESSFTQSDIYSRALQGLQEHLGHTSNSVQLLVRALGREAIRLTLRELVRMKSASPSPDASSNSNLKTSGERSVAPSPQRAHRRRDRRTVSSAGRAVMVKEQASDRAAAPHRLPQVPPQPLPLTPNSYAAKSYAVDEECPVSEARVGVAIAIPDRPVLADEPLTPSTAVSGRLGQLIIVPDHPILADAADVTPAEIAVVDAPEITSPPVKPEVSSPPETTSWRRPLGDQQALPQVGINATPAIAPPSSAGPQVPQPRQLAARFTQGQATMVDPAREQVLKQIAHELHQSRCQQDVSIEQLHHRTCVPIHHIRALEAGHFERLPEDIYLRGFVRLLGDAVGLDGRALAQTLPSNMPQPLPVSRPLKKRSVSRGQPSSQLGLSHLYLGYAALMAGATGGLVWMVSQSTAVDQGATQAAWQYGGGAENDSSRQDSLQAITQRVLDHISAIATPETNPPER